MSGRVLLEVNIKEPIFRLYVTHSIFFLSKDDTSTRIIYKGIYNYKGTLASFHVCIIDPSMKYLR